jgi:hypothetical protein
MGEGAPVIAGLAGFLLSYVLVPPIVTAQGC